VKASVTVDHTRPDALTEAPSSFDELEDVGDILVVDDNPANVLAIKAALGEFESKVIAAHSGNEALRRLLEHDFAVILLDVQMPSMDGFETARLIRRHDRLRRTPIIFVTAYDRDDSDVLQAYELGAVDFLFKPVVPAVLRAKIAVFVDLERRTAEVARQAELLRAHERREHEQALAQERLRWQEEALRMQVREERRATEALAARAEELARTVAERQRAERELTRINQRLEETDRRKDEFLAVLAHELRNPLAPLATSLEILRTHLDGSSGQNAAVLRARDAMVRQVRHMTRLVDDLLDVSRITSGKIHLDKTNVDMSEVVAQAISVSNSEIERRHHRLTVQMPDVPLVVLGDVVRLVQVVANLLNNAARYTQEGGDIRIVCERDGAELRMHVIDTGQGMDAEFAERVFNMFEQETPGGGGLGVGLTLVRRLVEMHDGDVSVHSDGPAKGSLCTVPLPQVEETAAASTRAISAPPGPSQRSLRIVVVDDNEDIRMTMRDLLESWGHTVAVAEDGQRGIEVIVKERPDVAIVDIGLPELDGCAVASRVRQTLGNGVLRLIAMTGYGALKDRQRAMGAGFDSYLIKPASAGSLMDALATAGTPSAE
jgi:CheY-like chemotaxis protein/nitrogen-specific signal transduction histidine kinase